MIYSQTDPQWGSKTLGESGLTMQHFGCTVTAVAQALTLAGHSVTPGDLVDKLNEIGGFTDDKSPQGAGLLIWAKVEEAYPQFHFGQHGFVFIQGLWSKFQHWVLKDATTGQVYDPFYGVDHAPAGFRETGTTRSASVDPATPPAEPVPAPTPEPAPHTHVVVGGETLWSIVKSYYSLNDVHEIANKIEEVAKANNIQNPDLIHPGQVLQMP